MPEEIINITIEDSNEAVNITVDETTEQVNITISDGQPTKTSDLINDGEDGVHPFITLEDIPASAVESVTGDLVDNTDPANPVINNPTLEGVLIEGNSTNGNNINLNGTDAIVLDNASTLKKGTYDFGADGGISRICGVGYEDMWQSGFRHVFDSNGLIRNTTNGFDLVPNYSFDVTLRFKVGSRWTLDNGDTYECTDATEGAAVWVLQTLDYVPYTGATEDVNLGEFGLLTGNIEFDNTPTNTPTAAGSMYYNDTDGTLDLKLKGGNVTLQIGQESVIRVVNKTATNITLLESNYQAVRVTGAQGQRMKVDLAQATTDPLSAETIGLVTETIANNQEGFVTTSGLVRGINTTGSLQSETWADGDILYLSPTVAGRITKVKPTAPNHLIIIGYVIHAHITQGSIFVKVDNGYELDELHNVKITTAANNNILVYTYATDIWENKTLNQIVSVRRNANNSANNNINYCGTAANGSAEATAVWTIKRLTIAASGSITILTATNVAWTNRESATYI